MEHDAFQMLLDYERERRKTPREREIEREIQAIAEKHKRAMDAELEPLRQELVKIEAMKAPLPVLVDGEVYEYVGPGAHPRS